MRPYIIILAGIFILFAINEYKRGKKFRRLKNKLLCFLGNEWTQGKDLMKKLEAEEGYVSPITFQRSMSELVDRENIEYKDTENTVLSIECTKLRWFRKV